MVRAITPIGLARRLPSRFKRPTPTNPSINPSHSTRLGHRPHNPPNNAAQIGIVATHTAASPLDTHCSANVTPPLPAPSSKQPTTADAAHCARVGAGAPRTRKKTYSVLPAIRNRRPAIRNGGKLLSAIRIPR